MFISISKAEQREAQQDKNIAKSILSLRKALQSDDPEIVAQALHDYELPHRTIWRFNYAIEWAMLGEDKVDFWKDVKESYIKRSEQNDLG